MVGGGKAGLRIMRSMASTAVLAAVAEAVLVTIAAGVAGLSLYSAGVLLGDGAGIAGIAGMSGLDTHPPQVLTLLVSLLALLVQKYK